MKFMTDDYRLEHNVVSNYRISNAAIESYFFFHSFQSNKHTQLTLFICNVLE